MPAVLYRGQPNSGESCISLQSTPTYSLAAKLPQHLSLAVPKLCVAMHEGVCKALLQDVVAPKCIRIHMIAATYVDLLTFTMH